MRHPFLLAAAVLTALSISPVHAQSLLRDVRSGPPDRAASSEPGAFIPFAGATWFTAVNGNGRELWRTDGTPQGTAMFVDLHPGFASSCRTTTPLIVVGGVLVFAATDPEGSGLWRTDGTLAGTRRIGPRNLWMIEQDGAYLVHGGVLWFAAVDGVHGAELWRTDGTDAGTRLVADVKPGSASGFPAYPFQPALGSFGAGVVFGADDGVHGLEPWYSDGTVAGTRLIADVWAGAGDSDPRVFIDLGGRLLFGASIVSNPSLHTWWTSDGTPAGTAQLSPLQIDVYRPRPAIQLGGMVLFGGFTYQHGRELWRTDGTPQGTWLVQDLYLGNYWSNPADFVELGGVAYFAARAPTNSTRLWRSDGTPQGTWQVMSASGAIPGDVGGLAPIGSALFFGGRTPTQGSEPWVTDGTSAGTAQLVDLNPGVYSSYSSGFRALGSRAIFRAEDGTHGAEAWISDGTASGTSLLADLHVEAPASDPARWTRAGERVFFLTQDRPELWGTDGTRAGTRLIAPSAQLGRVQADGDALLVPLNNSLLRIEAGEWTPRAFLTLPGPVVDAERVGDLLFVSASPSLYRYDPGASAPTLIRSFQSAFYPVPPTRMTGADGALFFVASEGMFSSAGLWRSDGTAAGTTLVRAGTVGPFSGGDSILAMLSAHGKLWFIDAGSPASGPGLWVADRSSVAKVADIGTAPSVDRMELVDFGGGVAFAGADPVRGSEPWFSDGTSAGTGPIADVRSGSGGSSPASFVVAGGALFFAADDGVSGRELWRSDGTAAGTVRVADLAAGPIGSRPAELVAAGSGSRVLFAAYDLAHGREPWTSDGTAVGTRRLADLVPGSGSSAPDGFVRAGAALVFAADDGVSGREPWVVSLADTGAWLAAPYGDGCAGTSGMPHLAGSGAARVGSSGFGAALSSARAASSVGLLGAARSAAVTLPGGCALLLDAPIAIVTGVTDGSGQAVLPLPIPSATVLVGAELRLQALVVDPAGALAGTLAMTGGLHVVIGR